VKGDSKLRQEMNEIFVRLLPVNKQNSIKAKFELWEEFINNNIHAEGTMSGFKYVKFNDWMQGKRVGEICGKNKVGLKAFVMYHETGG